MRTASTAMKGVNISSILLYAMTLLDVDRTQHLCFFLVSPNKGTTATEEK